MRIAIVNDTILAVEALRRILVYIPEHELIWTARNGAEAVEKCAADTPDLILMDLIMPVMDGVEATRRIMEDSPCAVLVVTSTVSGHAPKVFEAMGHGALDAVDTPVLGPGGQADGGDDLLAKIATIGKLLRKPPAQELQRPTRRSRSSAKESVAPLIAIGASTGGPMALANVLSHLPANFGASIVIIQHVDVQFSAGLASWLGTQTPLPVELAFEGCHLEAGKVWVAGTNNHLVMTADLTLSYTPDPRSYLYRPSVNVFFNSVALHWPGKGVGVVLTGMGNDGAEELKTLRAAGWHTIAQDEATSVVYGMPKVAAELAAATEILAIDEIGPALVHYHN
jgi:two-component system response regulator WspF